MLVLFDAMLRSLGHWGRLINFEAGELGTSLEHFRYQAMVSSKRGWGFAWSQIDKICLVVVFKVVKRCWHSEVVAILEVLVQITGHAQGGVLCKFQLGQQS